MLDIIERDESVSWEEITELLHRAYSNRKEHGMNFAAATQSVGETIRRAQPKGTLKYATLIAKENETLVGTITFQIRERNQEKLLHFSMFGVLPDYQKCGIGQSLLCEIEKIAANENCSSITMDTAVNAKELVKWYCRNGFQKTSLISWSNTNYYSVLFLKFINPCSKKIKKKIKRGYYMSSIKTRINYRADGGKRVLPCLTVRIIRGLCKRVTWILKTKEG